MRRITRALCGGLLALSVAFAAGCGGGTRGEGAGEDASLRQESGAALELESGEVERGAGRETGLDAGLDPGLEPGRNPGLDSSPDPGL